MPHDNMTPLQKLEAIPKVWLVWFDDDDYGVPFIYGVYSTKQAAMDAIDLDGKYSWPYFSIEWQPLLD